MAEKIIQAFESLSLSFSSVDHIEAFTIEDQAQQVGHLPGVLTKNLFLKDKKHGNFLVTVKSDRNVDTKTLAKKLNLGKANLRFGTEELLQEKLGVRQGAVTPLAVINDTAGEVKLILDKTLLESSFINCHPLQNDKTVSISPESLLSFLKHYQHEPTIIDFDEVVASETTTTPVVGKQQQQQGSCMPKKTSSGKDTLMKQDTKAAGGNQDGVLASKQENFADWYTETITKSGMIDYYDISGCYILRPWSYSIWEKIQDFLDHEIKRIGVRNCYFPMFVSSEKLTKEEEHLEGFAPEVAWVTKYGTSDLKEPIAIRPTSETIMYPAFKNWIRSHRDLPLKLNQWNNVVRWEFKNPTPFIRTREFLWQEGHTAHATKESADEEVYAVLDFYAKAYEEVLAVPMIKGKKTEKEKFAGADYTTTIEGFIPSTGRGIQAATSHHLGQNFGKMFNIVAEDERGGKLIPYQNSWGFTTRSIGVMIMVHGDDKGLVLPPRVAPVQVVIIPIPFKENNQVFEQSKKVETMLHDAGIRAEADMRCNYNPGWKYNHWELKGVPLRIEIGPRDIEKKEVVVVRRDNGVKENIPFSELVTKLPLLLDSIQKDMLQRATKERDSCIEKVYTWENFVPALLQGKMILTPFCNETEWEEIVKNKSKEEALAYSGSEEAENTATSAGAKSLCIPFDYNKEKLEEGTLCFISKKPATCWVLWGRSY